MEGARGGLDAYDEGGGGGWAGVLCSAILPFYQVLAEATLRSLGRSGLGQR